MKKVLLATSILAASAGFAAAEVATSGSARMGLYYDGEDAYFSSRVRITFTASGETDGGLSFGASVRADQFGGNGKSFIDDDGDEGSIGGSNTNMNDATVYISGAFGKLTFGDVDSAANTLVGDVSAVGYTGLGSLNEQTYLIGDAYDFDTSMLYEYSTGALSQISGGSYDAGYSVAVKYSTDAFAVALGYESVEDVSALSLGGSATFGAVTGKATIINYDGTGDSESAYALSIDYTAGPTTVTAFYRDADDVFGYTAFGLGAAYDLGGGATVKGGLVSIDSGDNETIADVGITMSF
jgi:outer membrane protein OmpU